MHELIIIPFGKYEGYRVGDLTRTEEGRKYLRWGRDNLDNKWAVIFREALISDLFPKCFTCGWELCTCA